MTGVAVRIAYLDGLRLARSRLAAADGVDGVDGVDAGRSELYRITALPVPSGDTGTPVALTHRRREPISLPVTMTHA